MSPPHLCLLPPSSFQRFTDCYQRFYQLQPEMTRRLYDKFITQLQTSVRVSGKRQQEPLAWVPPPDCQPPEDSVPAPRPPHSSVPSWQQRRVSLYCGVGVSRASVLCRRWVCVRARRGRSWASQGVPVPGAVVASAELCPRGSTGTGLPPWSLKGGSETAVLPHPRVAPSVRVSLWWALR